MDYRSLGSRDRHRIERAASQLKALPVGSPPDAVFDALRKFAPVAGGLIGSMGSATTGSAISHVVRLPSDVLEEWATTPMLHLNRMMAPLVPAAPGDLISDRQAITGQFREQLSLLRVIDSAGLGESAGYKVTAGTTPSGHPEHRFLTVALDGGEVFTPAQRDMFRLLHPAIAAALSRMEVPLIPYAPIETQIIEQDQHGYLCLSNTSIIEYNQRACELAVEYAPAAGVEVGRGWLDRFVQRVLTETAGGQPWRLLRHDCRARADIRAYPLPTGSHIAGQELTLVKLARTASLPPAGLAPRPQETADLLVNTGFDYVQIADHMDITTGTLRKYVEIVYRQYDVQSRAELMTKLR